MENATPKRRKPVYKKWWFWMLMGLATVATVIVIVAVSSSGSSNGSSNSGSTNTSQVGPSAQEYKMNDTVTINDFEFTVLGGHNTKEVSKYVDDGKTTQNFSVISIKIRNMASDERSVTESYMPLYRGEDKYNPSTKGIYLDNGFWYSVSLGPKIEKTVDVVYEMPSEFLPTDYIEFNYGFSSAKVYLK